MPEWPSTPLIELLSGPVRNGVYKTKEHHGKGVKVVNMGELFAHSRLFSVPMKRVDLTQSEKDRFLLAEGDLIFARRSLVAEGAGKCSIVLAVDEPTTFESSIIRARPDPAKLSSLYLYYFFSSHSGFQLLDTIRRQVAVAGITGSDLSNLRIPTPPMAEQLAMSAALASLDEKIELNRRMNETLEAMAQAIFRDWLVDFGPVRRKLAGATDPFEIMGGLMPDPARAAELAGSFPDGVGEDELPVGWSEPPLSEHLEIIGGGTPKTSNPAYWGGDIPWFSVVDTPSGSDVFVFDTEKRITPAGLAGSSARLIPAGTTIISARGTVGNLAIAAQDMTFNQSCYALQSARGDHPYFVYLLAAHAVDQLRSMAHGSVFSTITRQTFDAMSFASPHVAVLDSIEELLSPLFQRIKAAVAENRTLAETRDYLLPRLMSGEVRVGELEAEVA